MPDIFKFPNGGYAVTVLRKADVLKCIDDNIIDKDIAYDIIRRCEVDATNFLKHGYWAGIPFLGNIRIPKGVQYFMSNEAQELLNDAKANLDKDKYLLFRKQLGTDVAKRNSYDRYYKYEVSKFVGKNLKFFKKLCDRYGEIGARIISFTLRNLGECEEVVV